MPYHLIVGVSTSDVFASSDGSVGRREVPICWQGASCPAEFGIQRMSCVIYRHRGPEELEDDMMGLRTAKSGGAGVPHDRRRGSGTAVGSVFGDNPL
jgi:hypothetical protein